MEIKACPICGRPFSAVDIVLSEHDTSFQCRHCWNRAQATGPVSRGTGSNRKPRVVDARATVKIHRRTP